METGKAIHDHRCHEAKAPERAAPLCQGARERPGAARERGRSEAPRGSEPRGIAQLAGPGARGSAALRRLRDGLPPSRAQRVSPARGAGVPAERIPRRGSRGGRVRPRPHDRGDASRRKRGFAVPKRRRKPGGRRPERGRRAGDRGLGRRLRPVRITERLVGASRAIPAPRRRDSTRGGADRRAGAARRARRARGRGPASRRGPLGPRGALLGIRTARRRRRNAGQRIRRERRELGIDHALVGAVLVRRWSFPPGFSAWIERHHAPDAEAMSRRFASPT